MATAATAVPMTVRRTQPVLAGAVVAEALFSIVVISFLHPGMLALASGDERSFATRCPWRWMEAHAANVTWITLRDVFSFGDRRERPEMPGNSMLLALSSCCRGGYKNWASLGIWPGAVPAAVQPQL